MTLRMHSLHHLQLVVHRDLHNTLFNRLVGETIYDVFSPPRSFPDADEEVKSPIRRSRIRRAQRINSDNEQDRQPPQAVPKE